jgi:cation diffusion facilitator CzcD-associated flavoprotein CzcO
MNQSLDPDTEARTALRLIGPDPADWVPNRPGIEYNVAIIGGGQTGCALAFALRRAGIGKVTVLDAAADEQRAGVWLNAARMNLLRTPKTLPGPELGIPALSFQAWYEARHGQEAYAAIERIKRTDWADYLSWYKRFLGINPRYQTRLERIKPAGNHFRLHLTTPDGAITETARKVILATGFPGGGGQFIPEVLTANLPRARYAHTEDDIDFAALSGKIVGVVGAAASAFDAAGVALEHGAAEVHLFARRDTIAAVPVTRSRGFPGAYDNYHKLPHADRWQQAIRFLRAGSTPTTDAIERVVKFPDFQLHLSAPLTNAVERDGKVETTSNGTTYRLDFVIAGTGYSGDLASRPELRDFSDQILLWRHRYDPPRAERDDRLGCYPYLGAGHELLEKTPGSSPLLRHIHVQNPSGFVSFGVPTGDVPSMKRDIPVIAGRISADFFQADLDTLRRRMTDDVAPDFTEALYRSAIKIIRDERQINTKNPSV